MALCTDTREWNAESRPFYFIAHISVETLLEKETLGKEDMRRLLG